MVQSCVNYISPVGTNAGRFRPLALEELREDSASGKLSRASQAAGQAAPEEQPALMRKLFGSAWISEGHTILAALIAFLGIAIGVTALTLKPAMDRAAIYDSNR